MYGLPDVHSETKSTFSLSLHNFIDKQIPF
jgi:hypothetical protein